MYCAEESCHLILCMLQVLNYGEGFIAAWIGTPMIVLVQSDHLYMSISWTTEIDEAQTQVNGHFAANLDPLNLWKRELPPVMDPELYGFTNADMDRECVP